MLTHAAINKALIRAIAAADFTTIMNRPYPYRSDGNEIRVVRSDRQTLEAQWGGTIPSSYPRVLVTGFEISGTQLSAGSPECSQVRIEITYHIPYPATLPFEEAISYMGLVRQYLIDTLAGDPLPGGEEDNLYDKFEGHCYTSIIWYDQLSVEMLISHSWIFNRKDISDEKDFEESCALLMEQVAHIWKILLPEGYERDPLAPLSFLVSKADGDLDD